MESLIQQIHAAYEAFQADAALQQEKNNKAAGTRARKASLELEKLMGGIYDTNSICLHYGE